MPHVNERDHPSLSRRFDAVIFDLDGTLADTIPLIVASWNAAVAPIAGRQFALAEVISRFGVPDTAMLQRELAREHWPTAIEAYHAHYESNHATVVVFDGVPQMLSALRASGLPMGVMTGKGRRTADITLRSLGWESLFKAVITGDEAVKQKPAPDGPLEVARLLGAAPGRCAYVGDSPADMKAGRAAGMTTIAAAWHPVYLDRIRALSPDHWAEHPADVVRFVT
ncbi:MAG TPA: HAD family hydrolase [Tepidisphaeraceae bacterium]|jgi:2-phosphoglycolate phosphatase